MNFKFRIKNKLKGFLRKMVEFSKIMQGKPYMYHYIDDYGKLFLNQNSVNTSHTEYLSAVFKNDKDRVIRLLNRDPLLIKELNNVLLLNQVGFNGLHLACK